MTKESCCCCCCCCFEFCCCCCCSCDFLFGTATMCCSILDHDDDNDSSSGVPQLLLLYQQYLRVCVCVCVKPHSRQIMIEEVQSRVDRSLANPLWHAIKGIITTRAGKAAPLAPFTFKPKEKLGRLFRFPAKSIIFCSTSSFLINRVSVTSWVISLDHFCLFLIIQIPLHL